MELLHNSLALIGFVIALMLILAATRADLRDAGEQRLAQWLQERVQSRAGMNVEPDAIDRATAALVKSLPKDQAAVAVWLATKYRVAPEPVAALVVEAHDIARETKLDAHLILAIAAVESGFNPFAQSPVGAQGLMQVMTGVHADKYLHFGGKLAAFDPVTNLRVGVKVLQECIQRAGSVEAGLKYYVGAALHDGDGGYSAKVFAEQARLREVARGRSVPTITAQAAPAAPLSAADRALAEMGALRSVSSHSESAAPAASPAPSQGPEPRQALQDPVSLNKL